MLTIDAATARRFLVQRHFLAPPRALPDSQASILAIVDRLGSLQFDPLAVPGARNHDLVLHARIAGYSRHLLEELLYGPDRKLFEAYNKSLNILPLSELPFHRIAWTRSERARTHAIVDEERALADALIERLRGEGALPPSAFDRSAKIEGYWGTRTSLSRHVLEALFMIGRLGIARRDGNKRVYDLVERLFPESILATTASEEEAKLHRLLSRHRGVGLMGEGGGSELTTGTGPAKERARRTKVLVDRGTLVPVAVEGVRATRYLLANEQPMLGLPARRKKSVAFLAPLDPLVWDRQLLRELFAYDYIWEVYTPIEKRKHGYYVLPILFGDRLVGRIEPIFDRRAARLHVHAVWLEAPFDLESAGFLPALAEALEAYRVFVGARSLTFGRSKIAARIRRALT